MDGLKKLAVRLATEGPVDILATPRRIRILFNKSFIADTTSAKYIWEHKFYPQFYLPLKAFEAAVPKGGIKVVESLQDGNGKVVAKLLELHVSGKSLKKVISFESDLQGKAAELSDMVKVDFGEADQWFEEDAPIYVHPKDPYKRIEIIASNRPVRISVDGVLLAEASSSMHLYETGLPRRFYIPMTAIKQTYLQPSNTTSLCPYKGEANYYDVVLDGGKQHKDIVWYYVTPTIESAAVANLACFYNEKVDIELHGANGWEKL